jgi:RNA polymerase sigma-70 factor, ECF subfamily
VTRVVEFGRTMTDGDRDFHRIFMKYHPKIIGYLRRLVGEGEAEDVAQEVFVKVNKGLEDFRGESRLSTWIYRIATNAAMDHLRKSTFLHTTKRPVEDDVLANEIDMLPEENDLALDTFLIRKDMNECIRSIVHSLPENYRTVLVLSDLEDMTNAEISEVLDLTMDTVKIRLHRARKRLRKELDAQCQFYRDERNELACDRNPLYLQFRKV